MSSAPFPSSSVPPPPAEVPLVSDDARAELVAAAARDVRLNRPVYLLVVAGLLIVAGIGYFLFNLSNLFAAQVQLTAATAQTEGIRRIVGEITAVQEAAASPEAIERLRPDTSVFGRINSFATESGLITGANFKLEETLQNAPSTSPYQKKTYRANFTAQSAEAIFRWLIKSVEIKGLEVSNLELKPGAGTPEGEPRWDGSVFFTRHERR